MTATPRRFEDRHVASVAALGDALRTRGLLVDELDLGPAPSSGSASRVAFAREGSGAHGYAIVMTPPNGPSVVADLSLAEAWGRSRPVTDVVRDLATLDLSWVDFESASNREVEVLRSLVDLLSEAADDAVEGLRDSREHGDVLRGLDHDLTARRSEVLAATALLDALVSGAPIEWALRQSEVAS